MPPIAPAPAVNGSSRAGTLYRAGAVPDVGVSAAVAAPVLDAPGSVPGAPSVAAGDPGPAPAVNGRPIGRASVGAVNGSAPLSGPVAGPVAGSELPASPPSTVPPAPAEGGAPRSTTVGRAKVSAASLAAPTGVIAPGATPAADGTGADATDPAEPDDQRLSWRAKARAKRKNMPLWQELPLLLIVAFCLAVLIRTFLVQAFYIPSGSMENTLLVGDRVLVNKVLYDVREPARGEVVVFQGPDNWAPENQPDPDAGFFTKLTRTVGDLVGIGQPGEKDFIKRVIGLPGDTVACCDDQGRVTVNGFPLDESPYLTDDSPLDVPPNPTVCGSRRFEEVLVEPGMMFVMGDHRGVSQDSRCQGQVPLDNVIGRAFVVLWPSDRWSWLPAAETFRNVPNPAGAAPAPANRPAGSQRGPGPPPIEPVTVGFVLASAGLARARSGRSRILPGRDAA